MSWFIKQFKSIFAHSRAFEKIVDLLERVDGQQHPGLLRVLTYHRVDEPDARPWLEPGLISATPKSFEEQMAYLATNFNIVSAVDVLAAVQSRGSKSLPSRAILVTFDDAYCDFEEHAWPILKRYGMPATLFVPTAYPDHPERTFWWDDLYQALKNTSRQGQLNVSIGGSLVLSDTSYIQEYKRLKNYLKTLKHIELVTSVKQLCNELGVQPHTNCILGWDSLRSLAKEGVTLGAHTRTHPLMNRVSLEEARCESTSSLRDLEREIGSALPIFAYPSGEFSEEVVSMLGREDFVLAFTTTRGINDFKHTNPLQIRRINVGRSTTLPLLRAQLLSWTVHFNWLQTFING